MRCVSEKSVGRACNRCVALSVSVGVFVSFLVLFQKLLTVNNECSSSFSCLLTFLDLDVKEVNRLDSSFEARSTTPEIKRTT